MSIRKRTRKHLFDVKLSEGNGMRVLFFGTYDARRHPRVQVMSEGFAERGDIVCECNIPLGIDTAQRVDMLRRPWLVTLLIVRLARSWWGLWRRSRGIPRPDLIVVGYMGHFDVHLARRLWKGSPIALDYLISGEGTAVDRGSRSQAMRKLLSWIDRAALRVADIPCVDTATNHAALPSDHRERAVVVAVGAPGRWFRAPTHCSKDRLKVIFYGLYTPAQGAIFIGEAIRRLRGGPSAISFTMVGTGQDYEATRRVAAGYEHVTWVDWMALEELVETVALHDVCLGIFGTTEKGRGAVPNKVFQGAAAGCAIVTSDTPAQREAFDGAAIFVPPGDPDALATALRDLAGDEELTWKMRTEAFARADQRFRPAAVVEPLRERVSTESAS